MRSASTYGKTTTFSYDALGRRIAKRSEHDVTLFGWDGDTLAFESTQSTEGQQELQAWRGDSVHYIHEPGSFVPLVQIRQAQAVALSQTTDVKALIAANGGRYDIEQDPLWNGQQFKTPQAFAREEIAFYQCDHLGTPQELTDHEGRIAWSAQYKAWGEAKQAISEAGRKAGFRNPIRFQGQYFDDETGLHYNRYRYYDPQSGRFVSKDPIGLSGGINLHTYAPSSIVWIDPLGLSGFQPKPLKTGSVYRSASGTADSMTPRPGVDDVRKGSRSPGLSAATSIDGLDSGKYVELDIAHACSCGLDVIHDKADGHVTIRPANDPNDEKLKSWSATRGTGKPHSYTEGLLGGIRSKGKK
jgi:RHS repeat-associated protein